MVSGGRGEGRADQPHGGRGGAVHPADRAAAGGPLQRDGVLRHGPGGGAPHGPVGPTEAGAPEHQTLVNPG